MHGGASEVREQLCILHATAPQKFGYLSRYWRVAKTGLDNTDTTFAHSADIHANIPNPSVDTRTLGYTLQILADLDVLDAAAERNAATLYDLRSYDTDTLERIGRALDDGEPSNPP